MGRFFEWLTTKWILGIFGFLLMIGSFALFAVFKIYQLYPIQYDFGVVFNGEEYKKVIKTFLLLLLTCTFLFFLPLKKISTPAKFQISYFLSMSMFFFYVCYSFSGKFSKRYIQAQEEIASEKKRAREDMKNNNIRFRTYGLPYGPQNREDSIFYKKIDSIHSFFGVGFINNGCVLDPLYFDADKKYKELTAEYLEKRNGKNWEERMRQATEKIVQEKFKN